MLNDAALYMSDSDKVLLRLTLQVNNRCNLACSYCYQQNKGYESMSDAAAKALIDRVFEFDNQNYWQGYFSDYGRIDGLELDFIGGEPTLDMPLISAVTDYFKSECIRRRRFDWLENWVIDLETNGTTYFQPEVAAYIEKYNKRLDTAITLDGCKELHDACRVYPDGRGSYDEAAAAVEHYLQHYGVPNCKITLCPDNLDYFNKAFVNMVSLGLPAFRVSFVNENVWKPEHPALLYEQFVKVYDYIIENDVKVKWSYIDGDKFCHNDERCGLICGVNGTQIAMDWKGNLFNCFRFSEVSIDKRELYSLGSVDKGITRPDRWQALREVELYKDGECADCAINKGCEFCPAFNYEHTGELSESPRRRWTCEMHKAAARAFEYYSEKRKAGGGQGGDKDADAGA